MLGLNGQSEIPAVPFNVHYAKIADGYQYTMISKDTNYNMIAETALFEKNEDEENTNYVLQVSKREDAINSLSQIATRTKKFIEIEYGQDNYFWEYQDNDFFEFDSNDGFNR